MFKRIVLAVILVAGLVNTGCIMNQYSSEPNTRMDQMMNESEDLRQVEGIWRRFWFNDMPSHMTPERMHGGIMP